jgi:outer membrane protein
MKKALLVFGLALALFSCNKEEGTAPAAGFKTAYVDIQKLSDSLQEFKDLAEQKRIKEQELGRELQGEIEKFRLEAASFQNDARAKGPQWAQEKGQQLQKKEEQLGMMQQAMAKQLQDEFLPKNDSISNRMKKYMRDYGKKNGYDYIYATADISSVLYAKEGYDITDKILKELNDKYKAGKKDEPAKEEGKK